jgi:hypothetical protein
MLGVGSLKGVYRGSIALGYFLLGRRTFSKLRTLKS